MGILYSSIISSCPSLSSQVECTYFVNPSKIQTFPPSLGGHIKSPFKFCHAFAKQGEGGEFFFGPTTEKYKDQEIDKHFELMRATTDNYISLNNESSVQAVDVGLIPGHGFMSPPHAPSNYCTLPCTVASVMYLDKVDSDKGSYDEVTLKKHWWWQTLQLILFHYLASPKQ